MQAMLEDRPVTMVFLNSFGKLTRTADARRVRRWMGAEPPPVRQVAGGGAVAKK
jgi:D-alanyl-D-alanine endopeptidase (penicillin-binding protein 7)